MSKQETCGDCAEGVSPTGQSSPYYRVRLCPVHASAGQTLEALAGLSVAIKMYVRGLYSMDDVGDALTKANAAIEATTGEPGE